MQLTAGSMTPCHSTDSCSALEQPVPSPPSPSAQIFESGPSPRSPLSLDASDSPRSNPLQHVIVPDSPPHRQLQANACCNSTPGRAPPAFLQPLATVLQRCVDLNSAACPQDAGVSAAQRSPFHGMRSPLIGIGAYMERIAKYAKCSPVCFVMAEAYMERLAESDQALRPSPLNVHRLLLTGVMLAAKLMDDKYYNNSYYAKIGGVGLEELNSLELHMMHQLGFQLRIGALPVAQTLARINVAADAPLSKLVDLFGILLRAEAVAAIEAGTTDVAAAEAAAASAECSKDAAAAGFAWSCPVKEQQGQQRRSSLDCRVAASVMPFMAGGTNIAAH